MRVFSMQAGLRFLPILVCLIMTAVLSAQDEMDVADAEMPTDSSQVESLPPPPNPAEIISVKDSPNDHGHSIDLEWSLSPDDDGSGDFIKNYEIAIIDHSTITL